MRGREALQKKNITKAMMNETIYIALGSNIAHPETQIKRAISALKCLKKSTLLKVSSLYRTKPLGDALEDYINAVVSLKTNLSPMALLEALLAIEVQQGRERTGVKWVSRTLDLDILLYGDLSYVSPTLTIPHPEMKKRAFVLVPLYELEPNLCLQDGRKLTHHLSSLSQEGITRL